MIPLTSSEQFFEKALGQKRFPYHGQWELTCRCNLHCVMCYTDPFNTPERVRRELSTQEILRVLDEVVEEGCLELILTGGEPLARPDFFEIYGVAHQKGILLTVFTNGTLITEAVADRFAKRMPHRLEISLHGISQEVFESVTAGKGSFNRCLLGIDLLLERKIPLTLKTTAMTLNYEEVVAVKKYVDALSKKGDVRYRLCEQMRSRLDGSEDVSRFQVADEKLRAMELKDAVLTQAHLTELKQSQTPSVCPSQLHSFHIDAYGQLQLCSGNRRGSYDLRKGSFREGFYEFLPTFPCAFKIADLKGV